MMKRAIETVNERILVAAKRCAPGVAVSGRLPRLVAVSKLKPPQDLIEAYDHGQRYFGENYIKELEFKSNLQQVLEKCPAIKFHFIGHLQSNKVKTLLKAQNLHMIETVDSIKLADLIERAIQWRKDDPQGEPLRFISGEEEPHQFSDQLKVLIQVNTSDEDAKNGIEPHNVLDLAKHIIHRCKWLRLAGFMTIGRLGGYPEDSGPNKDFQLLYSIRESVSKELSMDAKELELSMGMSSDFEEAIEMGSTNVRVGTMIFGARPPKNPSPPPS